MATKPNEQDSNGNKGPSTYLMFTEASDGKLTPIASARGRNVNEAVKHYFRDNPDAAKGKIVVVPNRNLNKINVTVETAQKVLIKS